MIGLFHGMNQFHSWKASYSVCDLSPRTQKPAWSLVVSFCASVSSSSGVCGGAVMPAAANILVL